jgi:murein L,D-transpeptidase YcbB/YkuD
MIKSLDVSGIDGVFGSKTQDAVKSFQQGNNLTADGIVGPLTWAALPASRSVYRWDVVRRMDQRVWFPLSDSRQSRRLSRR